MRVTLGKDENSGPALWIMARHENMMAPKTHGNRGPAVDTLRYYCYVYCVPLGAETMNDKSHTSL